MFPFRNGFAIKQLQQEIDDFEMALMKRIREKDVMPKYSQGGDKERQRNSIAIIGMASLFPQAESLQVYWDNIINRVDCITDVPASRWDAQTYFDPDPKAVDKTYCKRGGFIPDIDFNPMDFGIPPNLLEVTDISQLLSLTVATQALEDAGYGKSKVFDRESVGVVLGVAAGRQLAVPFGARLQYPVWEKALKSCGLSDEEAESVVTKIKSAYPEWEENAFPGMLANIVSGRVANRLDLGGVNCTVDAACASSLAAFKIAVSELTEHRCDMMLTGGVDVDNSIFAYLCFSKTPALSRQQQTRPFDVDADGMMLGEGLGMVVLKRLEDAERDQDRIYAVIKGIGTSSDGRYKSIYAPSVKGQVKALRRAYADAGIAPDSVGLIEAHGTGTAVGDPTEFAALSEVFITDSPVALGSVKSQIGHTKAAAGTASLIKATLALYHKTLPATINVSQPNPRLNIEKTPFYLNTETRPWMQTETPRRAGVSSFGFGGTNYHVVLEEYEPEQAAPYRLNPTPQPVLLQAATPEQLLQECERYLQQLKADGDRNFTELTDTSKSLSIETTAARLGFVAVSPSEAIQKLESAIACLKAQAQDAVWEHPTGIFYRRQGLELAGKVVALFSGQGSQYLNMGRELVVNFPELRQTFAAVDALFTQAGLESPSSRVFPAPAFDDAKSKAQAQELQRTEYAQPALGAFSVGLYKMMQHAGFQPDFVAGHSFGELTALWSAGVFTDQDYFALVKARGQAMAQPAAAGIDSGTMLAVKGDVNAIASLVKTFPNVTIANHNSPKQVVLAGTRANLESVQVALKEQKFSTVWLPVSAAFHTSLVDYAQRPFAQAVDEITLQPPQRSIYTNVTAAPYPTEIEAIRDTLKAHLSQPVQFTQQIENIYKAGGTCFVEFGPRRILTGLVQEILGDRPHLAIALNASRQKDSDRQLREALMQLRVAGLALQDLDPYVRSQPLPAASNKTHRLNVRLGGHNYVSDKTQQSIKAALETGPVLQRSTPALQTQLVGVAAGEVTTATLTNGHRASTNGHAVHSSLGGGNPPHRQNGHKNGHAASLVGDPHREPPANGHATEATETGGSRQIAQQNGSQQGSDLASDAAHRGQGTSDRTLESLEQLLGHFNQHHSETLQTHQQYLNNHLAYTQGFLQLMQQQNALLLDSAANPASGEVVASLERNMMQFHSHQSETLRAHDQSIHLQSEYARQFFQLAQQQYGQLFISTVESPVSRNGSDDYETNGREAPDLLEASPVPQSELSLTGAWQSSALAKGATEPVLAVSESATRTVAPVVLEPEVAAAPDPEPAATLAVPLTEIDSNQLSQVLLTVVSDKTGYPIDMLDLEMDMEADLGIDSIKRFEILGVLMEQYPDAPQPDLETLAELEMRTLKQVVIFMASVVEGKVPTVQASPAVVGPSVREMEPPSIEIAQPTASALNETVPAESSFSVGAPDIESNSVETQLETRRTDAESLQTLLLSVVSDKTGYPIDMLDLEMDMEADLGIDSIKRFEILGALLETYPDAPQPDLEALAEMELRTLNQVVAFMHSHIQGDEKKKPCRAIADPADEIHSTIQRRPVHLKFLPRPDQMDFQLPNHHVGVITDYGSAIAPQVAHSLTDLGWKIVVLSHSQTERSSLPKGVEQVSLEDLSESHLETQLAAIATQYGSIGAFMHLHPQFSAAHDHLYPAEESAVIKQIFFMAKHLKQTLNQAAQQGQSCFLTVAHLDGAFGLQADFSPLSAGLFGLTKSLNWEWNDVFCRAIDLAPELDVATSVRHILAELHDPNRLVTEVGYSAQGRATLVC